MNFLNKCLNENEVAIKWASIELGENFYLSGKTVLINLKKLNKFTFYPLAHSGHIEFCNFIGSRDAAKKAGVLKEWDLMIYRNQLSKII